MSMLPLLVMTGPMVVVVDVVVLVVVVERGVVVVVVDAVVVDVVDCVVVVVVDPVLLVVVGSVAKQQNFTSASIQFPSTTKLQLTPKVGGIKDLLVSNVIWPALIAVQT